MNEYKQYELGNGLRGTYRFKARSIKEAWTKGCKMFNRGFPTRSKSCGRHVILSVYDSTILPMYKTKWVIDQDNLPPKKRHFCNHEVNTERGYVPVAKGRALLPQSYCS